MALLQDPSPSPRDPKPKQRQWRQQLHPPVSSSLWDQFKNLLSCKNLELSAKVRNPSRAERGSNAYLMLKSSCSTAGQEVGLLKKRSGHGRSSSSRSLPSSSSLARGSSMQFRKLSGCYECHMIVDPSRYPYHPRSTICACLKCGEVFHKVESLELHQAVRHAVSELGPSDSGRNIVEIIFKSSWIKNNSPICMIERILKVHNTPRTIQRFEECRDAVKALALVGPCRNPRCAADGNELLRFHCATLACSLGSHGSSSLCGSVSCRVCTIIRLGFQGRSGQGHGDSYRSKGVQTTASSGCAHDLLSCSDDRKGMLVCRVIAGKVKLDDSSITEDGMASSCYDSVTGHPGMYANLEDLHVFNPKAILPCFVVIYRAMEC